jgi:hypothetical protein
MKSIWYNKYLKKLLTNNKKCVIINTQNEREEKIMYIQEWLDQCPIEVSPQFMCYWLTCCEWYPNKNKDIKHQTVKRLNGSDLYYEPLVPIEEIFNRLIKERERRDKILTKGKRGKNK